MRMRLNSVLLITFPGGTRSNAVRTHRVRGCSGTLPPPEDADRALGEGGEGDHDRADPPLPRRRVADGEGLHLARVAQLAPLGVAVFVLDNPLDFFAFLEFDAPQEILGVDLLDLPDLERLDRLDLTEHFEGHLTVLRSDGEGFSRDHGRGGPSRECPPRSGAAPSRSRGTSRRCRGQARGAPR